MQRLGRGAIRILDDPDYFRSAVNYTAAATAFPVAPIEKDFFCTLLLEYLNRNEHEIVFKGGTALAKVHAGFYRLSEDLDFTLPMPIDSPRSVRSRRMGGIRYHSPCLGSSEVIRLDMSLREPLLTPVYTGHAQTILRNPVNGSRIVHDVCIPCLSWQESWAEKFRAALSRRDVAIRDFYDIDVAVRRWNLDSRTDEFTALVHRKLSTPGFEKLDLSSTRLRRLQSQIDAELRPVLRPVDFEPFDLNRAVGIVEDMARRIREIGRQHPATDVG